MADRVLSHKTEIEDTVRWANQSTKQLLPPHQAKQAKQQNMPDQPDQHELATPEQRKNNMEAQVLHALRVEEKSMRQVARETGLSFRQVRRINVELYPINTSVARATLDRDVGKLAAALLSPDKDLGKGHDAKQLLSALTRLGVVPGEQAADGSAGNNVTIAFGSPFMKTIPAALEPPSDSDFEQTAKANGLEIREIVSKNEHES